MEADWYEDPLGRYDGRFFDGTRWTAQVSVDGVLSSDPDFVSPPPTPEVSNEEPAVVVAAAPLGDDEEPPVVLAAAPLADNEEPAVVVAAAPLADNEEPAVVVAAAPLGDDEPAVAPVGESGARRANLLVESPARTVAVLDESLVRTNGGQTTRPPLMLIAAAALALLALVALVVSQCGSEPAEEPGASLDSAQEDRVRDLASGGAELDGDAIGGDIDAPEGVVPEDTIFTAADGLLVGPLQVVNGVPLLNMLDAWHRDFASERGIVLDDDARCWFGQLGGAAVQAVHCGPVSSDAADELFDVVPVVFVDVPDGQLAQPVIDAVMIDTRLANAIELVGP